MRKLLMFLGTSLLLIILSLSVTSGDLKAKAASDLYPLPAPIIDVFPDEGLATDMARNLKKGSVNDVIDQADLDALTGLGFETETITNDSMQLLERAMFNNVTDVSIMSFGRELTEFPDITTIPHLKTLFFVDSPEQITRSLSLPDYQNYPEMDTITMAGNNLIGSIPDFTGMPALKQLYMSDMFIATDAVPNFHNIPLLVTLDLSSNQLTTIPDFQNTPKLVELNLGDNQITSIPDFQNLPNLRTLNLNANALTNTPDFQNLPNLTDLILRHNNLTGTMVNYTNLPSLESLDLDYNFLTELPSNVLDTIYVQSQNGVLPDQTINQGDTCTIDLPIYFQMKEINMLISPEVTGSYIGITVMQIPTTVNTEDNTITLDTSALSPGEYKLNVEYNLNYATSGECSYDWNITIN
ncbi:leucine-rich repeat domain-containing protein [Listeria marthii]|nr:leucine-rich repeat domain-containing protein [Listeria marthii]UHP12642.1 leucine-rich repeat domain-containing protein [Listeria marthii]